MVDNFEWIYRCIRSCKNEAQLLGARRLMELFKELHCNEKTFPMYHRQLWAEWRLVKKHLSVVKETYSFI